MSIPSLLAEQARTSPTRPFVVTEEASFDYALIDRATAGFAGDLSRLGVAAGQHVVLAAGNSAAFLVAWFGINRAGAVAVILNTEVRGEALRSMIARSGSVAIVGDAAWWTARGGDLDADLARLPRVEIGPDAAFVRGASEHEPPATDVTLPSSSPATILYTSGTTGLPKGVVNSHTAYVAAGRHTVDMIALRPEDRCMVVLPLFHANPQMYAVMSALAVGSTLVLRPRFSAGSFFTDARRFGATGFTFVGTILSILAARHQGRETGHAMRFCLGGGAPLKVWREVEERFGVTVHELYGMTEIGGWVSANTVAERRIGSCGRARPDMDVRIVDEDDRERPAGEAGEIVVRPREPDVILSGYHGQPDKMVEACRNLWFHTGDRGIMDADGFLFFQGRLKELIRKGGEMVSPVEIETVLRKMPAITDCAAVGVECDILGQDIKVVLVTQAAVAPEAVHAYLADHLPRFMLPRYVEFASEIPKTETEKVQRHKIAYTGGAVHDLGAR